MRKFLSILAVLFLLPSLVFAASGSNGNDDGFPTSMWVSATSGATTTNCSINAMTDLYGDLNNKYGSFDAYLPFDGLQNIIVLNTSRNPMTADIRATTSPASTTTNNNCRFAISYNETCEQISSSSWANMDVWEYREIAAGSSSNSSIVNFNANYSKGCGGGILPSACFDYALKEFNDYAVGKRCVKIQASAHNGVSQVFATENFFIGVAPRIVNMSLPENKTIYQNQRIQHSQRQSDMSAISNISFFLMNNSNNASLKGTITDISPETNYTDHMSSFTSSITHNHTARYVYTSWEDNATIHTRFSDGSDNTNNGTRPMSETFVISPTPPTTITSQDGKVQFRDNMDGYNTIIIEGVEVANFSGSFYNALGNLIDITWTPTYESNNLNYSGQSLLGDYFSWYYPTANTIKFGANFSDDVALTQRISYDFYPYADTEVIQDQNIDKRIYLKNPSLSDYYVLDYNGMPDGTVVYANGSAEKTYTLATDWSIDPNIGGTEDGFDVGRTVTATDTTCAVTTTVYFKKLNALATDPAIGEYDDPDDPATARTPGQVNYTVSRGLACVGATNIVRIRVKANESCQGTREFIDINVTMPGAGTSTSVVLNQATGWATGAHCTIINSTAHDGVLGAVSANDTGMVGVSPYLPAPSVSETIVNMFYNQTQNHSMSENDATNITTFVITLHDTIGLNIGYPANELYVYGVWTTNESAIGIPVRNTYTSWEDNAILHTNFSTSSQLAVNRANPKTNTYTILKNISCDNYVSGIVGGASSGIYLFNRGEQNRLSINLKKYDNATPFNLTTAYRVCNVCANIGVSYELNYTVNNVSQFGNTTQSVNQTGAYNANTTITTNANATLDFQGQPYNSSIFIFRTGERTINTTCITPNVIAVSRAYNQTAVFNSSKVYLGKQVSIQQIIRNARQELLAIIIGNVQLRDANGVIREVYNGTTNATGQHVNGTNYVTLPLGTWTANVSNFPTLNSNNTAIAVNGSIVVSDKAGFDPLTVECEQGLETNMQVLCIAHSRDLDQIPLTNSIINSSVLFPDNTTVNQTSIPAIGVTGDYQFSFTATQAGRYMVGVNSTVGGTNYFWTIPVRVKASSSGALTADQNATLYATNSQVFNGRHIEDIDCESDTTYQGATLHCSFTQSYSNGSYRNDAEINYSIYNTTLNVVQSGTATNFGVLGAYAFEFTPSVEGHYYVVTSNTTYNIAGIHAVHIENTTINLLNSIKTDTTNILAQFPLIPSNVWAYNFIIKQSQIKAI